MKDALLVNVALNVASLSATIINKAFSEFKGLYTSTLIVVDF